MSANEVEQLRARVQKWQRIRTPTHGRCCTCQGCGLNYDDCRCDLDIVADEVKQLRAKLAELRAWAKEGHPCLCSNCDHDTHGECLRSLRGWIKGCVLGSLEENN